MAAQYTVTILNRAPHAAAAKAFVKFLLSKAGLTILKKYGVTPLVPPVVTKASGTPSTTTTLATTTTT